MVSINVLRRFVGQFGPASLGRRVKSSGSWTLIYSRFCSSIAFVMTSDLWTLGRP